MVNIEVLREPIKANICICGMDTQNSRKTI